MASSWTENLPSYLKNINGMIWFEKSQFMTRQSNIYVKLKCLDTNIVSCLATWLSRYLDMYVWGRWWVGWWFKLNYIHQPGPANTAWSLQTSGSLIELSTASIQRGAGRKEEKISCHWISEIFPKTCTFLLPAAATTCGILLRGPINSHGVAEEDTGTQQR